MVLFCCVIKLSLFKGDEVHCDKAKVEYTSILNNFLVFAVPVGLYHDAEA